MGGQSATDWEWWRVKAALDRRGLTQAKVARAAGLSVGTGVKNWRWPAMQKAIADAIGMLQEEIWPSRYDEAGRPVPDPSRRKAAQSANREAA